MLLPQKYKQSRDESFPILTFHMSFLKPFYNRFSSPFANQLYV